jgi:hypothetical protein
LFEVGYCQIKAKNRTEWIGLGIICMYIQHILEKKKIIIIFYTFQTFLKIFEILGCVHFGVCPFKYPSIHLPPVFLVLPFSIAH